MAAIVARPEFLIADLEVPHPHVAKFLELHPDLVSEFTRRDGTIIGVEFTPLNVKKYNETNNVALVRKDQSGTDYHNVKRLEEKYPELLALRVNGEKSATGASDAPKAPRAMLEAPKSPTANVNVIQPSNKDQIDAIHKMIVDAVNKAREDGAKNAKTALEALISTLEGEKALPELRFVAHSPRRELKARAAAYKEALEAKTRTTAEVNALEAEMLDATMEGKDTTSLADQYQLVIDAINEAVATERRDNQRATDEQAWLNAHPLTHDGVSDEEYQRLSEERDTHQSNHDVSHANAQKARADAGKHREALAKLASETGSLSARLANAQLAARLATEEASRALARYQDANR